MAELQALLEKTPVVVLLDKVDPHCIEIVNWVKKFKIEETKVTFFYTDEEPNGKKVLEQAGKAESDLPIIYLQKKFYFGGQELKKLSSTTKVTSDLVDAGALQLKQLEKAKELASSAKCVAFVNNYSPYSTDMKATLLRYLKESNPHFKIVETDKLTAGPDIDVALLYLSNKESMPLLYLDGKCFGGYPELKKADEDFEVWDILSKSELIPPLPYDELNALKKESEILIVGNDFSPYSLNITEIFNGLGLNDGVLRLKCEGGPANENLENAAKVDCKEKAGPFVYIKGKHISHHKFDSKDAAIAILKEHGIET